MHQAQKRIRFMIHGKFIFYRSYISCILEKNQFRLFFITTTPDHFLCNKLMMLALPFDIKKRERAMFLSQFQALFTKFWICFIYNTACGNGKLTDKRMFSPLSHMPANKISDQMGNRPWRVPKYFFPYYQRWLHS
jgi:hypothetical protein